MNQVQSRSSVFQYPLQPCAIKISSLAGPNNARSGSEGAPYTLFRAALVLNLATNGFRRLQLQSFRCYLMEEI